MPQFLMSQCFEVTCNSIANGDVDSREQFENGKISFVDLHDKHTVPLIHDRNSFDRTIVNGTNS